MADFELAVAKTIKNEGGDKYTETEGDRGGATKYGISLRFLGSLFKSGVIHDIGLTGISPAFLPTKETIKNLTLCQAKFIYERFFWDANRYGEINDQAIAEKVFDMAVLMGAPTANKIFQQNVNFLSTLFSDVDGIKVDGIIGDKTLKLFNEISTSYYTKNHCLTDLLTRNFISICNKDKSQSKFLLGWLNRVMS